MTSVLPPVEIRTSKRQWRHNPQRVCSWNQKFSHAQPEGSPFAPRAAVADKDSLTLARARLAMSQEKFCTAFKGSPMNRAKRHELKRNVAVALGNVGTRDDATVLDAVSLHEVAMLRAHAVWSLIQRRTVVPAPTN